MNNKTQRFSAHWTLSMLVIGSTAFTLLAACGGGTEQRVKLLEDEVKMLLVAEAQPGFKAVFKTEFKADNTQLLLGSDLEKWVQDHRPKAKIPEAIRTAIRNHEGAALLIQGGLPGKNGPQNVVYMRSPRFGFHRFFLKEEPDPCGDGNPAMCEYCSGGCIGEGSSGCYCTLGCGSCQSCPKC